MNRALCARVAAVGVLLVSSIATFAQAPAPQQTPPPGLPPAGTPPQGRGRGGPAVISPEIGADGRVTFRLLAPQASSVTVGGDINGSLVPDPNAPPPPSTAAGDPAAGAGRAGGRGGTPVVTMTKGENGVWAGTTVRAVKPGAWRYTYNVDGAPTVDIRNTRTSPNQMQVQSLLVVPGDFSETRDVPHGAVAAVHYVASALNNARREMFVYTPPGYEKGSAPVRSSI